MEISKLVICYLNGTEPSDEILANVFGEPTGTITKLSWITNSLVGGFKHFLFSSLFGEDSQFDDHIFQMGWNHQPAPDSKL